MFDQKDVSRVKRDLWYCTKFYREALGSEDLAYERGTVKPSEGQENKMVAGSEEAAEEGTEKEASTKKSKSLD